MTVEFRHALPVEQTGWKVLGKGETSFCWNYDDTRADMLKLYDKGCRQQWMARTRIDWDQAQDPDNPMGLPDQSIGIYGSDIWIKMSDAEKTLVRQHFQAWMISNFLHGEQGALVCTSRLVQEVPSIDAKYYAATQVLDEARHVEIFARLLKERFQITYPITPGLKNLLEQILGDSRWDLTYLGMQVLIEGLALGTFQQLRDQATNPLVSSINAYVMQDEARHVAFGRIGLRQLYSELSDHERREREEFVAEACLEFQERFLGQEVWQALGLPVDKCLAASRQSHSMTDFNARVFSRIVPVIKDIGLWGPRVVTAFEQLGILQHADVNLSDVLSEDESIAEARSKTVS